MQSGRTQGDRVAPAPDVLRINISLHLHQLCVSLQHTTLTTFIVVISALATRRDSDTVTVRERVGGSSVLRQEWQR